MIYLFINLTIIHTIKINTPVLIFYFYYFRLIILINSHISLLLFILIMAFGIVDYIVFGIMLVMSASIGIYYRFTGGKQKTTQVIFHCFFILFNYNICFLLGIYVG